MIYEVICFGYEVDMLRGRMATLGDHVDRVIVVESDHTHTGKPKGYLLNDIWQEMPNADRLAYHQFQGSPSHDAWANERAHREMLKWAVEAREPDPDDLVIVCDVDEWWQPEHLDQLGPDLTVMNMRKHHFSVRWFDCMELAGLAASWQTWQGLNFHDVKMAMCAARGGGQPPGRVVDTGWHWTSIGDLDAVNRKVASFSHMEFNTPDMRAAIAGLWEHGRSLARREFAEEPLDGMPAWIADGHAPASWYRTRGQA